MTAKASECAVVAKYARTHPDKYYQGYWITWPGQEWNSVFREDSDTVLQVIDREGVSLARLRDTDCATTGCLAGITAMYFAPEGTRVSRMGNDLYLPDGTERSVRGWAGDFLSLREDIRHAIFDVLKPELAVTRLEYVADHPDTSAQELRRAVPQRGH